MREYQKTSGGVGGNTKAKRSARAAALRAAKNAKLTPRYCPPEEGCEACGEGTEVAPATPGAPKKKMPGVKSDKLFVSGEPEVAVVINCGPLPACPPGRSGNDPRHSGR